MCGQSHSRWPCSGDGRGQLLHHREGQQRPRHSCHECHRLWKRVSGRGPHHHPRAKDSPSGPPGPPRPVPCPGRWPFRASVSERFPLTLVGAAGGKGGCPGGVGTGRHPKSDGKEWGGVDFRWRLEAAVGSQPPLATSPRARCGRLSSRGAASELWPYLVHGGKGSWWGPGQFSARGPGGPGELGGGGSSWHAAPPHRLPGPSSQSRGRREDGP